ncbi:MAG TPA: sigma-70 family RNA polymerase sigma factor [Pyrinomonadaceae bacterium]|nr:sigma-70 family RNA polymerase sigma factor [Pyrinomonadaceae bacterium]
MSLPQGSITSSSQPELASLIARVAEQDQLAMAALYDASNRVVFGLLLRILNEPTIAEEVVSDVYMQVWRQANSYDEVRGTPMAWMLTIARSRAIDRLRSGRQELLRRDLFEPFEDKASSDVDLEAAAEVSAMQRRVRTALSNLPIEQREVIELAYFNGLSHSEIALKLNQPLGTVKTRTRLGMMKLRDTLNQEATELMR